jgi:hypothetical protein
MSTYEELRTALGDLLLVLNRDKDGGWFVCEEARDIIDSAASVYNKAPEETSCM